MKATVHARTLSDGSIVWDVDYKAPDDLLEILRFGCQSEEHAQSLAAALNDVAFIDLVTGEWR